MKHQRGSLLVYAILGVVALAAVAAMGKAVYDAGSDAKQVEWDAANEKQRKDEADKALKAGVKKEQGDAKAKVVFRTITQTVDKIVTRDVYRNICLDDDGLLNVNAALSGALTPAREPDKPLPPTVAPSGRDWSHSATQDN